MVKWLERNRGPLVYPPVCSQHCWGNPSCPLSAHLLLPSPSTFFSSEKAPFVSTGNKSSACSGNKREKICLPQWFPHECTWARHWMKSCTDGVLIEAALCSLQFHMCVSVCVCVYGGLTFLCRPGSEKLDPVVVLCAITVKRVRLYTHHTLLISSWYPGLCDWIKAPWRDSSSKCTYMYMCDDSQSLTLKQSQSPKGPAVHTHCPQCRYRVLLCYTVRLPSGTLIRCSTFHCDSNYWRTSWMITPVVLISWKTLQLQLCVFFASYKVEDADYSTTIPLSWSHVRIKRSDRNLSYFSVSFKYSFKWSGVLRKDS